MEDASGTAAATTMGNKTRPDLEIIFNFHRQLVSKSKLFTFYSELQKQLLIIDLIFYLYKDGTGLSSCFVPVCAKHRDISLSAILCVNTHLQHLLPLPTQ